jgi:hypothetical protein
MTSEILVKEALFLKDQAQGLVQNMCNRLSQGRGRRP